MEMDIEQQRTESPPERSRFINPNFVRLWIAGSLSRLGDTIFEITLTVWIASQLAEGEDWSALAVTGLLVASAIPVLLVGPIAGALIDRWPNKRRVILRADIVSAALILLLIPAAGIVKIPGIDHFPLWWRLGSIFVIVLLASVVAQFFSPASQVMLRDIVPDEDRARAASLSQATSNLAVLIGPSLAAPVLFAFGASWALLFNAASFFVSFLFMRSLKVSEPLVEEQEMEAATPGAVAHDIREGLQFFRNSPALTTLAVSFIILMVGVGALNTLDIFFVTNNLSTSAKNYGFLVSAQGASMVVGAIIWGRIIERIGPVRAVWIGLLMIGVLMIVYARLTSFEAAIVLGVLFGFATPAINVAMGPIFFRVTPREYVGRVNATFAPIISASMMLGVLGSGVLY
ncbi:MAG: MFS transporter, partial [Thermomicrobiales bacterium]